MSKLTDSFRTIRIFNADGFAKKGEVYISYYPQSTIYSSRYIVYRKGFNTDPNAAWYNYGSKSFTVWGREDKREVLGKAQKWAGDKYGIKVWAKTPYGNWMDKDIVASRIKELKARIKVK